MKIYAAPLEGITGYVFRNAFHSCFDCVDQILLSRLSIRTSTDI